MSELRLRAADRTRHVYISGKTQQGKSTLIHALALQDIRNGEGVCVIDAKGDLVPQLIHWVPGNRRDDCIYLDLKTPVPLDFMSCKSPDERTALVSDIIQIFTRLDANWGVRMAGLLRYVLHTLLLHGPSNFLDIYWMLADKSFQERIVKSPQIQADPTLRLFWRDQIDKLGKDAAIPIIVSRMADFMLSPALRTILGTTNAKLNIADCMESRKIILVNLEGATDEAMVFGSLIVSKLQQAAFRRANIPKEKRIPFMLYVDEFQDFKSSGFEQILSKAGGLRLCLTLSNQYLSQLETSLQDAIVNNVSSYFLFKMAQENATRLRGELREPPPPPPADARSLKDAARFWRDLERDAEWSDTARIAADSATIYENEIDQLRHRPKPTTFYERLPHLSVGHCVYRAADGTTKEITTPAPAPHTSAAGKTSYAQYIKKRTVDKYACNSDEIPHDEKKTHHATDYDNIEPIKTEPLESGERRNP